MEWRSFRSHRQDLDTCGVRQRPRCVLRGPSLEDGLSFLSRYFLVETEVDVIQTALRLFSVSFTGLYSTCSLLTELRKVNGARVTIKKRLPKDRMAFLHGRQHYGRKHRAGETGANKIYRLRVV